jgi:bifunctional DNA-binding transcriptional regulator/antitoxin component of YhaV-PrlF toxin-antitoxin module
MSALVKDDAYEPRQTKVSSKNQVTLPVAAMAAAHVKPGDTVRVEVAGDGIFRLVRERSWSEEFFDDFVGSSPGLSAAANLDELRDEWER